MKPFLDRDFLLDTETARTLYHDFAAKLPVFDYHCHLDAQEIYEDKHYQNITELWLYGDHYKWRFMRWMGTPEELVTGSASDYDKFLAYAKCLQFAAGNPLYHWSHLELERYFGISEPLTEQSAPAIWEAANKVIQSPDFSARGLIRKSNVAFIGTTDDPTSDLRYHKLLAQDKAFQTAVCPTFRPDKSFAANQPGFCEYIGLLGNAAGIKIEGLSTLLDALSSRIDYFDKAGCRSSDHSFLAIPFVAVDDAEADRIFREALAGQELSDRDLMAFQTTVMTFLGRQYCKRGWVMQLHMGALRNNSSRSFRLLGPDTGFDSPGDEKLAASLSRYLDCLDADEQLPKTILYTLNPKDNYTLAAMAGNFYESGQPGKVQFGSAWWFNDHIDGMREQMKALANVGALAAFVGMLTDSRSFLSYPRHEYFRRILCGLLGGWVENGLFPNDMETLRTLVENVSYKNAEAFFTK